MTISTRRTLATACVVALVVGCGGSGGGGGGSGGGSNAVSGVGSSNGGTTPPSTAPVSFEVVNNAPAANATGVSLNPTIYLTFSKDVDTATLLVSNLRLSKGAVSIPAAISYDAAGKTLNIRPQNPLPPRSKIDITVTGIRDSTGAAPSNPGFSFTTGRAAISQTLATDPVTGAPVIVGDQLDSDGRLARTITYLNSGIDGIPFNADDVVKSYDGFLYDAAGNLLLTTAYGGAGNDGIWFNGDDVAVSSVASEYDAAGY